jgi:hypothetical protein
MNAPNRPSLFSPKLVFGLIIIAVGLILMLDSLHLYDAWRFLTWWPLALVAIGIAHLVRDGFLSFGGHIWLGFAVAGFIQQFGPWGLLDRWWPIFLVWGGAIVTLRAVFPQPKRVKRSKAMSPSPTAPESCDPEAGAPQVKP